MKSRLLWIPLMTLAGTALAANGLPLTGQVSPTDPQTWEFTVVTDARRAPVMLVCQEENPPYERHVLVGDRSRQQSFTVRGLKAEASYVCVASSGGGGGEMVSDPVEVLIEPLPDDLVVPEITIPTEDPEKTGFFLYNSGNLYYDGNIWDGADPVNFRSDSNYLVILDAEGNVRWWYPGPGAGDFEATYLGDGVILFGGQGIPMSPGPTLVGLNKEVLLSSPQTKQVEYELSLPFGLQYNHESRLGIDGEGVWTLIHTADPEGSGMEGFIVKELGLEDPDGNGLMDELLWYWDSFEAAAEGQIDHTNSFYEDDPLHPNAVWDGLDQQGKRSVYVSLRNNSRVIKIDYDTREVVWELGYSSDDFILLEANGTRADLDRWFFNQHDVKLNGDVLTAYDNGTDQLLIGSNPHTRVLQLQLDEEHGVARIIAEYTEAEWSEPFWGGYDVYEDGSALVNIGHCGFCSGLNSQHSALFTLSPRNEVTWRATFMEDQPDLMTYRSERIDGCAIFAITDYCSPLEIDE